ncbi:MAG: hypothetical protein DMG91_04830 [Acidobacteria bacterium]|jgi:hypothetical protein|nr:MAG: hypothetical protein DMG91_04830 [Acidobacteriota bacterium]
MQENPEFGARMRLPVLRAVTIWTVIASLPLASFGADSTAGILHTSGATWINGAAVPKSSAVFAGDLVQTKPGALASINSPGSNVMLFADSLLKYGAKDIVLQHGSVAVATSNSFSARVGEITVTPATKGSTEFRVTEHDGVVQVVAQRGDVNISDGSQTSTVSQGQQTTLSTQTTEHKRKRRRGGAAIPAGSGTILNSTAAVYVGAAVAGGVATWVLLEDPKPISPSCPDSQQSQSCPP